jgi:hypothetical protein
MGHLGAQAYACSVRRSFFFGARFIGTFVACVLLAVTLVVIPGAGATSNSTSSLARSITLGTRLTTIPANLSPSLADVPNDTPYSCIDSPSASVPQSVCTLGDVGATQTVVLFGDSHAWQWTPALNIAASERDWKLVTYTKGGCPVQNVGATVAALDESSTNCAAWRNAAFAKISALRPALVIISSQTKGFVTAKDMTETVSKLKADGAKVVWLEDTLQP